jgi:hypothetical protein
MNTCVTASWASRFAERFPSDAFNVVAAKEQEILAILQQYLRVLFSDRP